MKGKILTHFKQNNGRIKLFTVKKEEELSETMKDFPMLYDKKERNIEIYFLSNKLYNVINIYTKPV